MSVQNWHLQWAWEKSSQGYNLQETRVSRRIRPLAAIIGAALAAGSAFFFLHSPIGNRFINWGVEAALIGSGASIVFAGLILKGARIDTRLTPEEWHWIATSMDYASAFKCCSKDHLREGFYIRMKVEYEGDSKTDPFLLETALIGATADPEKIWRLQVKPKVIKHRGADFDASAILDQRFTIKDFLKQDDALMDRLGEIENHDELGESLRWNAFWLFERLLNDKTCRIKEAGGSSYWKLTLDKNRFKP